MRPTSLLFAASTLVAALGAQRPPAVGEEPPPKTLWVAPYRAECPESAARTCYLVKESQYEPWQPWSGEIEGLEYEEGFAYELRVSEAHSPQSLGDSPAVRLRLVEVVHKVEAWEGSLERPSEPSAARPARTDPTSLVGPAAEPAVPSPPDSDPHADRPRTAPTTTRQPGSPPGSFRGHLTIGQGLEARAFRMCNGEQSLWVEDQTGDDLWATYRQLAGYPNRPLFMVVRGRLEPAPIEGFGAHYGEQLVVTELRHAAAESAGCFGLPSDYLFVASGNEPFWRAEISPRGIALSEMGREGRLLFPFNDIRRVSEGSVYFGEIGGSEPHRIRILLVEEPCFDTMVDARYSYRAVVTLDHRELTGCALEGLANDPRDAGAAAE